MALPKLTSQQRADALAKASVARADRAAVKNELKAGTLTIAMVFERAGDNEALARLKVTELLTAMPGIGPARAHDVMQKLAIAPSRRVRGLGVNQRAGLLNEFGS
jgi:hypothetical protein